MHTTIARYRIAVVLLTAALLATLTVTLTGGERADAVDGPVEVVYVATGRDFPDALAGSTLAVSTGAPMLTVEPRLPLPPATIAALEALDPNRIVVFGGPGAVPDEVVGALTAHARSGSVTRIAGADRHDTAGQIADALPDRVADSDLLDGLDSTDFLRTTQAGEFLATDSTVDELDDLRSFPLSLPGQLGGAAGNFGVGSTGVTLDADVDSDVIWQVAMPTDYEPGTPIEVDVALTLRSAGPTSCDLQLLVREVDLDVVGLTPDGIDRYTVTKTDTTVDFERLVITLRHPGTDLGPLQSLHVGLRRDSDHAGDTCNDSSLTAALVRYGG